MSDFLTMLWKKAAGLETVVEPLIAPVFAPAPDLTEESLKKDFGRDVRSVGRIVATRPTLTSQPAEWPARRDTTEHSHQAEQVASHEADGQEEQKTPASRSEVEAASRLNETPRLEAAEERQDTRTSKQYLLLVPQHSEPPVAVRATSIERQRRGEAFLGEPSRGRSALLDTEQRAPLEINEPSSVEIHIGRIDVRATIGAPATAAVRPAKRDPLVTLEDYLQSKSRGR